MCCGIEGPGDWNNVTSFEQGGFPDSCCETVEIECGNATSEADPHMQVIFFKNCP